MNEWVTESLSSCPLFSVIYNILMIYSQLYTSPIFHCRNLVTWANSQFLCKFLCCRSFWEDFISFFSPSQQSALGSVLIGVNDLPRLSVKCERILRSSWTAQNAVPNNAKCLRFRIQHQHNYSVSTLWAEPLQLMRDRCQLKVLPRSCKYSSLWG